MREWEASRSRTEAPWSASRRRLRESRWDAARLRRSPTVEMLAGAAKAGEAATGEFLVLGFATGEDEGERKLRSAAGDAAPADGEEPPERRETGLAFALGLALARGFEAVAAVAALAFLMVASCGTEAKRTGNMKFKFRTAGDGGEAPAFIQQTFRSHWLVDHDGAHMSVDTTCISQRNCYNRITVR